MEETHQTIKYRITRETSRYNKYMKWHVECFHDNGKLLSSNHTKTKKEAEMRMSRPPRPIPVGNRLLFTHYKALAA